MTMSIDQALLEARDLPPAEAEALYREMLARFPANERLQHELEQLCAAGAGNAPGEDLTIIIGLYQRQEPQQALDAAALLLGRFPNCEILNNITGAIHAALGQYGLAVARYDKAIELAPDFFEALNNRGIALNDWGRHAEAVDSFDLALRLHRDYPEALMNRGIALRQCRRLEEAVASTIRAIELNPRSPEAYNTLGNILLDLGHPSDALAQFEIAIKARPNFAEAYVNLGNALMALKRLPEAVDIYDLAIGVSPSSLSAHNNRGTALRRMNRLDEALASHRQGLEIAPASALARAEIRNLEAHMCSWSNESSDLQPLELGVGNDAFPPFYMLNFEDDPIRQKTCSENWTRAKYGSGHSVTFPPRRSDGKIRVGYFSADFHNHATMYLMARLFELHDCDRFEIHAFSYGPDVEDEMRQRLVRAVGQFHSIGHLSDGDVARLAREKGIDIAIDLKGHTQDARLGIFAHRAAPIQAGLLGFPGTSGSDFIDYVIADEVVVPPESACAFSEKIAYLPNSYYPTDDLCRISDRSFTRAELGLPEQGFVFCSFNNNYKIKGAEFDIWMRLLDRIEGSILWLLQGNEWVSANLRSEAAARGIAPERLVFAERMPLADHLARHRHADLFLDTFVVNAHTTATDALWAGLPVLTKLGNSFVARVAGSVLTGLGMPELIATSAEAYEARAFEIATNPAELRRLKTKLAENRLSSSLFDSALYTRDMEALYERMISAHRSMH